MLDDHVSEPTPTTREVSGTQLSLFEMFFITTLCAVALWTYLYVSPTIAMLGGSAIVFVAAMRLLGHRPVFIGGIAGFLIAMFLSCIVCALAQMDTMTSALIVLVCPCIGYVVGAAMTELADDGF